MRISILPLAGDRDYTGFAGDGAAIRMPRKRHLFADLKARLRVCAADSGLSQATAAEHSWPSARGLAPMRLVRCTMENLLVEAPAIAGPKSGQHRAQCELAHTSQAVACATIFRYVEPKCERNLSPLQARQDSGRGPTARLSAANRQGPCVLSGHHLDEHLQGVRPHELGGYGRSDHRSRCA